MVQIHYQGKARHIGYFDSQAEAIEANATARRMFDSTRESKLSKGEADSIVKLAKEAALEAVALVTGEHSGCSGEDGSSKSHDELAHLRANHHSLQQSVARPSRREMGLGEGDAALSLSNKCHGGTFNVGLDISMSKNPPKWMSNRNTTERKNITGVNKTPSNKWVRFHLHFNCALFVYACNKSLIMCVM